MRIFPAKLTLSLACGLAVLLVARGGGSSSTNSSGSLSGSGNSGNNGNSGATIAQVQHFAIVVLENLDYGDVVGSPKAPYMNRLISQGGVATILVGTDVKAGFQGTGAYDHRSLLGLSMTALGVSSIPTGPTALRR